MTAYLTCRQRFCPNTANPHLFIHYRNASTTRPVTSVLDSQTSRHERPADPPGPHPRGSGGDIRLICDLFGLSVAGAYRYTATADHASVGEIARSDNVIKGARDR